MELKQVFLDEKKAAIASFSGRKIKTLPIIIALVVVVSGGVVYLFRDQIFASPISSKMADDISSFVMARAGAVHKPLAPGPSAGIISAVGSMKAGNFPAAMKAVQQGSSNGSGQASGALSGVAPAVNSVSNGVGNAISDSQARELVAGAVQRNGQATANITGAMQTALSANIGNTASTPDQVKSAISVYQQVAVKLSEKGANAGANDYAFTLIQMKIKGTITPQDQKRLDEMKAHPDKYGLTANSADGKTGFGPTVTKIETAAAQISKATFTADYSIEGTTYDSQLAFLANCATQVAGGQTLDAATQTNLDFFTKNAIDWGYTKPLTDVYDKMLAEAKAGTLKTNIGNYDAIITNRQMHLNDDGSKPDATASPSGDGAPTPPIGSPAYQTSQHNPNGVAAQGATGTATPTNLSSGQTTLNLVKAVQDSGVNLSGLTEAQFTTAQNAAAGIYQAANGGTVDVSKMAQAFIDSLPPGVLGTSTTTQQTAKAALTKLFGDTNGKLLMLLDPTNGVNLLTGKIDQVDLTEANDDIQTAKDFFDLTDQIKAGNDPFGLDLTTDPDDPSSFLADNAGINLYFLNDMITNGMNVGGVYIAGIQVAQDFYIVGGISAGNQALAAFFAQGDPGQTQLLLDYMNTDLKNVNPALLTSSQFSDMFQAVQLYSETGTKTANAIKAMYSTTLGFDQETGHVAFTTSISTMGSNNKIQTVGYISFDPITQKYYGNMTTQFGNKDVTIYADPRTGATYASLSNADQTALAGVGGNLLKLMSVSVSQDGSIGGSFKLMNRLFTYNPATKAFEVQITGVNSILGSKIASKLPSALNLTLDSNGHLSGSYNLFNTTIGGSSESAIPSASEANPSTSTSTPTSSSGTTVSGSLYFDSTGDIALGTSVKSGGVNYGGVNIDEHGNIAGAINVGQLISSQNIFLSFGKGGITGAAFSVGKLGIGIGANGALSATYPIPIAGIPIPISIAQNASGNFSLKWPGGSMHLFGNEDRSLTPPPIQVDANGNDRMECVFFFHSFKKLSQTVKVWNTDPSNSCPLQINSAEQIARSDKIFDVMNKLLGRNPTYNEFYSWYFYGADLTKPNANPASFEYDKTYGNTGNDAYRTLQLESVMRRYITTLPEYKNKSAAVNGQAVTTPLASGTGVNLSSAAAQAAQSVVALQNGQTSDPGEQIMPYNMFDPAQVAAYQAQIAAANGTSATSTTGSATTSTAGDTSLSAFFNAVQSDAASDPYWDAATGTYTVPSSDTDTVIQATTSATPTTTTTVINGQTVTVEASATADTSSGITTTDQTSSALKIASEQNAILTNQTLNDASVTIAPGFNAVYVPRDQVGWDASSFSNKGLVVYDFNPDGSESWKTTTNNQVKTMQAGFGYYVYNPTSSNVIVLPSAGGLSTARGIQKGWNLLANSTSLYAHLSDLIYNVAKPGNSSCTTSSCMMSVSLVDMFNKDITQNTAYQNLFLIKDATATSSDAAFTMIPVTQDNLSTLIFNPGDVFWLYKWK